LVGFYDLQSAIQPQSYGIHHLAHLLDDLERKKHKGLPKQVLPYKKSTRYDKERVQALHLSGC
jgi:hypothetical protein